MQSSTLKRRYSIIAAICCYGLALVYVYGTIFVLLPIPRVDLVTKGLFLYSGFVQHEIFVGLTQSRGYWWDSHFLGCLVQLLTYGFMCIGFLLQAISLSMNKRKGTLVGLCVCVVCSICILIEHIRMMDGSNFGKFAVAQDVTAITSYVIVILLLTVFFKKKGLPGIWFIPSVLMAAGWATFILNAGVEYRAFPVVYSKSRAEFLLLGFPMILQILALFFIGLWLEDTERYTRPFSPQENVIVRVIKRNNPAALVLIIAGVFATILSFLLAYFKTGNRDLVLDYYDYDMHGINGYKFFISEYGSILLFGVSIIILAFIVRWIYEKRKVAVTPDCVLGKLARNTVVRIPLEQIVGIYPCSFKGIKIDAVGAVYCFYDIKNRNEVMSKMTALLADANRST